MPRILGVDIPADKRIDIALRYIYGIGPVNALEILERANIDPETVIREGITRDEVLAVIDDDKDIAQLVLAAGDGKEGPGPLVASVAGRGAAFPIPVLVLPAGMSDEEVEAVA